MAEAQVSEFAPRKKEDLEEMNVDQISEEMIAQLPEPTGYRIMILPFKIKEKTKGGIVIADAAREREQVATVVGLVLKMGSDAYTDPSKFPHGAWCKEQDWVIFGRYAGARIPIDGGEIRLLNDDEVLATIDDPESILQTF